MDRGGNLALVDCARNKKFLTNLKPTGITDPIDTGQILFVDAIDTAYAVEGLALPDLVVHTCRRRATCQGY